MVVADCACESSQMRFIPALMLQGLLAFICGDLIRNDARGAGFRVEA